MLRSGRAGSDRRPTQQAVGVCSEPSRRCRPARLSFPISPPSTSPRRGRTMTPPLASKALEAAENALSIDQGSRRRASTARPGPSFPSEESGAIRLGGFLALRPEIRLGAGRPGCVRAPLSGPDAASRWAIRVQNLEEAVSRHDAAAVRQIVAQFPQAAREHAGGETVRGLGKGRARAPKRGSHAQSRHSPHHRCRAGGGQRRRGWWRIR